MNREELSNRTRKFAVDVFTALRNAGNVTDDRIVVEQVLRSSSSVAANYRAALRAKSNKDFSNKLKIVLEEADETEFWLCFMVDVGIKQIESEEHRRLLKEARELTAIFAASVKTLSSKHSFDDYRPLRTTKPRGKSEL